MTPGQEIVLDEALRQLRLPAIGREWREYARQAKDAGEGYVGFLLALANRELEQRQANQIQRRLREARFPLLKTLETTDLNKWPVLDAVQVRDYAECGYITRRENVVLLGKHGTGKTHAATVLGVEACRKGYRVGFTTAAALVNTLIESREERGLNRRLARLSRFELLIVDEVGYIPFSVRLASPCTAKPRLFYLSAAMAMGFRPSKGSAPPVGTPETPPEVIDMPIIPLSSARCAKYAAAP